MNEYHLDRLHTALSWDSPRIVVIAPLVNGPADLRSRVRYTANAYSVAVVGGEACEVRIALRNLSPKRRVLIDGEHNDLESVLAMVGDRPVLVVVRPDQLDEIKRSDVWERRSTTIDLCSGEGS